MVIGQLGARGHAALPTVGLDNGGGQGHVTTRSPWVSDKIAWALHRNSQLATSKNVLQRGDHGLSIQHAPCRVDPVPEFASGPARYPMSASTVVWTSLVWGSARSPNPVSNKSVMTQACGTFGRPGQTVPRTEYSSDTERVWNTPRRSAVVRTWRCSPASSWAQELSLSRLRWDTDVNTL